MENTKSSLSKEGSERLFNQIIEVWVIPTIEQKRREGKITGRFLLSAAQIIFRPEKKPIVRLNSEVKGIIDARVTEKIVKYEKVFDTQIKEIKSFRLPQKKIYKNCGHITVIQIRGTWYIFWDLRYNKEKIQKHLEAAKEFLETARISITKNNARPFFENIFAAAEHATHSLVLVLPERIIKGRDHGATMFGLKAYSKLFSIDERFFETLRKLNSLRQSARYLASNDFLRENQDEILKNIEDMIQMAKRQIE